MSDQSRFSCLAKNLQGYGVLLAIIFFAAGCAPRTYPTPLTIKPSVTVLSTATQITAVTEVAPVVCNPKPITVPIMPAVIPKYTFLDEATGLHMTGTPIQVNLATYRFKVTGLVDHPLDLGYDDLRCMPRVTATPTLICQGFFEDVATWSGVPLKFILDMAGVQSKAQWLKLVSADGYKTSVALDKALKDEGYLAYELRGQPLPVLHGFPLRAIFPAMGGSYWAKWLVEIKVE